MAKGTGRPREQVRINVNARPSRSPLGSFASNRLLRVVMTMLVTTICLAFGCGGSGEPPPPSACGAPDDATPLHPKLACVATLGGREYAVWGYNSVASKRLHVPLGPTNFFQPAPQGRGQPIDFDPGLHEAVFATPVDAGASWTLGADRAFDVGFVTACTSIDHRSDGDYAVIDGAEILLERNVSSVLASSIVGTDVTGSPQGQSGPTTVGWTQGVFATKSDGSAAYTVPIWVPPGRAGIQPNLKLAYSSHAGDGFVGYGWTLEGLSTISRCPKNQAINGLSQGISYSGDDQLCLDGDRLLPISSPGQNSPPEFRAEHRPFARIVITASDELGPKVFQVFEPGGNIQTFGGSDDARLEGGQQSFTASDEDRIGDPTALPPQPVRLAWAESRVEDRVGNAMDVHYRNATGTLLPLQIRYTSSPSHPFGNRVVAFGYNDDRQDPSTLYTAGLERTLTSLLTTISLYGPNPTSESLIRTYQLQYNYDLLALGDPDAAFSSSRRSLLQKIRECDSDGVCKLPLTFDWNWSEDFGYEDVDTTVFDTTWDLGDPRWALIAADINGDGMDDVMYRRPVQPFGNNPDPTRLRWFYRLAVRVDDGGTHAFTFGDPIDAGLPTQHDSRLERSMATPIVADLDMDGRADVMFPIPGHGKGFEDDFTPAFWKEFHWRIDPTTGNGTFVAVESTDDVEKADPLTPYPNCAIADDLDCPQPPPPLQIADLNGDGLPELIKAIDPSPEPHTDSEHRGARWAFRLNTPTGFVAEYQPLWLGAGAFGFTIDPSVVNGPAAFNTYNARIDDSSRLSMLVRSLTTEGSTTFVATRLRFAFLPDLTSGPHVTTLLAPDEAVDATDSSSFHYIFLDMNGDGMSDALRVSNNDDPKLALNTGNGFGIPKYVATTTHSPPSVPSQWAINNGAPPTFDPGVRVMDTNQDGRSDLVLLGNKAGAFPHLDVDRAVAVILRSTGADFVPDLFHVTSNRIVSGGHITPGPSSDVIPLGHFISGRGYPLSQLMDIDGDGQTDIVQLDDRTLTLHVFRKRGERRDLLSAVHTGAGGFFASSLGGDTEIFYTPFRGPVPADPTADPTSCKYPTFCKTKGLWVVSEYRNQVVSGGFRFFDLGYDGARSDLAGRGFLGFGSRTLRDDLTATTVRETYDNVTLVGTTYPFANMITAVDTETDTADGAAVTAHSSVTYDLKPAPPAPAAQPYAALPRAEVTESRENGALLRRITTTSVWDDFGNRTSTTTDGELSHTHVEETFVYDNDTTRWLLGLLRRRIVTSTAPGFPSETRTDEFDYDAATGLLLRNRVEPSGSPDVRSATQLTRNGEGLVTEIEQVDGTGLRRIIDLRYDALDGTHPESVSNALGHVVKLVVHPGFGVLVASVSSDGVQTLRTFDKMGRMRSVHVDGGDVMTTHYTTSAAGGYAVVSKLDSGPTRTEHLDILGRLVRLEETSFSGSPRVMDVSWDFRFPDRVASITRPHGVADPPLGILQNTYDELGRLVTKMLPDGHLISRSHTGLTVDTSSIVSGVVEENTLIEDELGRVTQSIDRGVISTDGATGHDVSTNYAYGPFNELKTVTDSKGHVTSLGYDVLGRRTTINDPDAGTTIDHYNAMNDLVSETDATGTTRSFIRDALGRLEGEVATPPSGSASTTCFYWDTQKPGRLSSAKSPDGVEVDYSYDAFARIKESSTSMRGETFLFSREYDPFGRLSVLHYPTTPAGSFAIRAEYGADGDLSAVYDHSSGADATPALWNVVARRPDGLIADEMFGNGVETKTQINDKRGWIDRIDTTSTALGTIMSVSYLRDENGNVTHRTNELTHEHESFDYDALDRLTHWSSDNGSGFDAFYTYDDLGNLRSRELPTATGLHHVDYTIDSAHPHQLASSTMGSYAYDASGNQTSAPRRPRVAYTPFKLPSSVDQPGGRTAFGYDAFQVRAWKQSRSRLTLYAEGLYEKREASGTSTHVFYVPGARGAVAQIEWSIDASGKTTKTKSFLHPDGLGSDVLVTSEAGLLRSDLAQRFDPFGVRVKPDNPRVTAAGSGDLSIGFAGAEEDDETGLTNLNARLLDPVQGRFTTPDQYVTAAASGQSFNRYAYSWNNPLNIIDPSGLSPEDEGQQLLPVYIVCPVTGCDTDGPTPDSDWQGTPTTLTKPGDAVVHEFGTIGDPDPTGAQDDQGPHDGTGNGSASTASSGGNSQMLAGETGSPHVKVSDLALFGVGFYVGFGESQVPAGVLLDAGPTKKGSDPMLAGKGIGEILGGVWSLVRGIGGGIAGIGATSTGAGAVVGVPVLVASGTLVTNGALSISAGIANIDGSGLMSSMLDWEDIFGEGPEGGAINVRDANGAGVKAPPRHHLLPQAEKKWFEARNVDIDKYTVEIDQATHEAIHELGWNNEVMDRLYNAEAKTGRLLTEDEIVTIARDYAKEVGIDKPFIPYNARR